MAQQGWGIVACGGVPLSKDPEVWEAVFKLRDVTEQEAIEVLGAIEGQSVVDARKA